MLTKGRIGRIAKQVKPKGNDSYELKPHKIPNDMVVIIDTREQNPLWLPKPMKDLVIMRGTLQNGDYSLRGHENTFTIERKQQDLFSYLTSERDRTKVKLEKLRGMSLRLW